MKKSAESVDDKIDINRCCIYFGTFTDGVGLAENGCSASVQRRLIENDDVNTDLCKLCPLC